MKLITIDWIFKNSTILITPGKKGDGGARNCIVKISFQFDAINLPRSDKIAILKQIVEQLVKTEMSNL